MYALVTKFKAKSGREDETKAMVSAVFERLKDSKGFISAVICSDEETNEWIRTAVWETKEDQVAYVNSRPPELKEKAEELVDGPIEAKGYDVVGYVTAD